MRWLLGVVLIGVAAITATAAVPAARAQTQQAASQTVNIEILNFKFVPATVSVAPGTRIVWTNLDEIAHSIVSDNGAFRSSSPLDKTGSYSIVSGSPGNYPYHCGIHSYMQGTIRVIAAGSGNSGVVQP